MVSILDQLQNLLGRNNRPTENRPPIQHKPRGTSGTDVYAGYFAEEYLIKLRGLRGADLYDEMRRSDSQIAMLLSVMKNPIKSAKWTVEAQGEDQDQIEMAGFIEHCLFKDISNPETGKRKSFNRFLTEALTMIEFGYSLFEVVHKQVRNHPEYGDYIGLSDIGFRSHKTIETWNLRQDGSIDYVHQLVNGDLAVSAFIPGENLLHFAIEQEGDNYEGISLIRPCYGNFYRKNVYLKFMAIGMERGSTGVPVALMSEDFMNRDDYNEQFETVLDILEQFSTHEIRSLALPSGIDVKEIKLTFDAEKVQAAIDAEDVKMTKRFLANFMEMGLSGTGSYSLGSDLSDIFLSGIEYIAGIICEEVNNCVIPKLIDAKYGKQDDYPKLVCRGINDKAGKELADIINGFVQSGIIMPSDRLTDYVHDVYGLPEVKRDMEDDAEDDTPDEPDDGFEVVPEGVTDPENDETLKEIPVLIRQLTEIAFAETDTVPPKKAQDNARKGLELRRKYNRGGTEVGVARARDISNGASLSRDTIARMSAFKRHEGNYRPELKEPDGGATAGTIAWLLWGGNEGIAWAQKTLDKIDAKLDEIALAEPKIGASRPSVYIQRKADDLEAQMRERLEERSNLFIEKVRSILSGKGSDQEKVAAVFDTTIPGKREYDAFLRSFLGEAGKHAQKAVLEELGITEYKFAQKDFDGLPRRSREKLKREIELVSRYQDVDIEKLVYFAVNDEIAKGTPVSTIIDQIKKQSKKYIAGAVIAMAAVNIVSKVVNGVRNDVFREPDIMDTIESFIFINADPVSDICKNLNGRVFSKEEYESSPYLPPLHHNCKSYVKAQTKGKKGNKPIDPKGLTPSGTDEELDKIYKSKTI